MGWILAIVFIIVLIGIISNIRVVPQATAFVIERLGAYKGTWNVGGLHVKVPFIERIACKVSLKEQVQIFHHNQLLQKIM